jgi:50S ribosomal subunit-associated GTPase HflX
VEERKFYSEETETGRLPKRRGRKKGARGKGQRNDEKSTQRLSVRLHAVKEAIHVGIGL